MCNRWGGRQASHVVNATLAVIRFRSSDYYLPSSRLCYDRASHETAEMQTGFCLIAYKGGFVVRRYSIYTTIPVDGRRMVPQPHLLFDAWLDDSTGVDSNFQADRGNKEPGRSRDCTKWDHRDGLIKYSAWTVLTGFIHTATTTAWEDQQYCLDFICLRCADQRQTAAFDRTPRTPLTNEYGVRKRIWIRMFNSKFEFLNFV